MFTEWAKNKDIYIQGKVFLKRFFKMFLSWPPTEHRVMSPSGKAYKRLNQKKKKQLKDRDLDKAYTQLTCLLKYLHNLLILFSLKSHKEKEIKIILKRINKIESILER